MKKFLEEYEFLKDYLEFLKVKINIYDNKIEIDTGKLNTYGDYLIIIGEERHPFIFLEFYYYLDNNKERILRWTRMLSKDIIEKIIEQDLQIKDITEQYQIALFPHTYIDTVLIQRIIKLILLYFRTKEEK